MCPHGIVSGLTSEVNAHLGRKLSTTLVWNLTAPIVYPLPPSKTQNGNKLSQRKLSPSSLEKTDSQGKGLCCEMVTLGAGCHPQYRGREDAMNLAQAWHFTLTQLPGRHVPTESKFATLPKLLQ